jgi:hypothetical protein
MSTRTLRRLVLAPLLLVSLGASSVAPFVLHAVPIEAATCHDRTWYRYHFAIRLCDLDREEGIDFGCTRRLVTPRGWFASEAEICSDPPWIREYWPPHSRWCPAPEDDTSAWTDRFVCH